MLAAAGVVLTCIAMVAACGTTAPQPVFRPPGSKVLSDAAAARAVNRSSLDRRPSNRRANQTVPTARELARFRRLSRGQRISARVTGRFTGTTDDIIEWGARKWGLDPDLLRAQAVSESSWVQRKVGDNGRSFGILQIKRTIWRGSYPLSARSTAFNVDLAGAILRQTYDGRANWFRPDGYRRGDIWGSLGAYYSGRWNDADGLAYVERVRRHYAERSWSQYRP